jgi:hypothetical protein
MKTFRARGAAFIYSLRALLLVGYCCSGLVMASKQLSPRLCRPQLRKETRSPSYTNFGRFHCRLARPSAAIYNLNNRFIGFSAPALHFERNTSPTDSGTNQNQLQIARNALSTQSEIIQLDLWALDWMDMDTPDVVIGSASMYD